MNPLETRRIKIKDMETEYRTKQELEECIEALSETDLLRLKNIAEYYTGNHELEAEDLLHEAICRVLTGSRKACPLDVEILTYIAGILKSIAYGEREKCKRIDHYNDKEWQDIQSLPDQAVLEEQAYNELESLFEDDDEILLLIFYLSDEASPEEIQKSEGWSKTKYDSIRKRMRRKWNAHTAQEQKS